MDYIRIVNGPIDENCYVVWEKKSREAAIIDPGFLDLETLKKAIIDKNLKIKYIVNTHGHWDHIKNNKLFKEAYGAKLVIHKADVEFLYEAQLNLSYYHDSNIEAIHPDIIVSDQNELHLGGKSLKIMHTPGHTLGSIVIYDDEIAFTGDTLFYGSIGRCDLPKSDRNIMEQTLEKLKMMLPYESKILPGHGTIETTFKEQMEINPFLTGKMKPK